MKPPIIVWRQQIKRLLFGMKNNDRNYRNLSHLFKLINSKHFKNPTKLQLQFVTTTLDITNHRRCPPRSSLPKERDKTRISFLRITWRHISEFLSQQASERGSISCLDRAVLFISARCLGVPVSGFSVSRLICDNLKRLQWSGRLAKGYLNGKIISQLAENYPCETGISQKCCPFNTWSHISHFIYKIISVYFRPQYKNVPKQGKNKNYY